MLCWVPVVAPQFAAVQCSIVLAHLQRLLRELRRRVMFCVRQRPQAHQQRVHVAGAAESYGDKSLFGNCFGEGDQRTARAPDDDDAIADSEIHGVFSGALSLLRSFEFSPEP